MDVGHCNLDGNADAVEFCRHESYYNVLAASTYVLQEGDHPSRSGSITLFDVDANVGRLELIHKVETAGIFDLKWSSGNHPLLAQADADGYVRVYSLQYSDSESAKLNGDCLNEVYGKCISSSMCLCIDWNSPATSLAVGLSDGSISIVSLDESQLNILQEWKAHSFELWAAAFDIQQPMLVYTGSDDCKFSCWDLREDPSQLVFQNTKAHKMGVCCIAKSPHDPNILLTGSYDEYLRIWDVRSTPMPISESSIPLGGGVWRIKHHPHIPGLVLTACMHNGFAIVKFEGDQVEVVETYKKHGSLAYGADWQRGDSFVAGGKKSSAVATCSFYDQLLRVWTPESDVFKVGFLRRAYDPCTEQHSIVYFNLPEVQDALHIRSRNSAWQWETCSDLVSENWQDSPRSVLNVYLEVLPSGIRIWMFSGDTDAVIPVTSTRYSIDAQKLPTVSPWRAWYDDGQVGGWTQEYKGLTFVTVRGAGHEVPLHKPKQALTLIKSFLSGASMPKLELVSDSILSDCIAIGGRKRIPYFIISTLLSLFPWFILGIDTSSRTSRVPLMILLTVQNLGSAMADVMIDAMIAEAVRFERASFAGDLQSLSWMAMAFGGICGSLIGGYTLNNIPIEKIFLLFSALAAIQLLSYGLVEESSVGDKVLSEYSSSNGDSHLNNGKDSHEDNPVNQNKVYGKKSGKSPSRRKRGKKSAKQGPVTARESQAPSIQGFIIEKWLDSLKNATFSLLGAFRQPIILSLSGTIGLYNFLDGVLVSRSNLSLGISDKVMVIFGSALSDQTVSINLSAEYLPTFWGASSSKFFDTERSYSLQAYQLSIAKSDN